MHKKSRPARHAHIHGKPPTRHWIVEAVVLYQDRDCIFFEEEIPDCCEIGIEGVNPQTVKKKRFRMGRRPPTLCCYDSKRKRPDVYFLGPRRFYNRWNRDWLKAGARVTILASNVHNRDHTLQARAWTNRDEWNMCYPEVIKPKALKVEELLAAG